MRYLIPLLLLFSTASAEVTLELGPTFLSSTLSNSAALMITERWGGKYSDSYSIGMGMTGPQEVTDSAGDFYEVKQNLWIQAQRRFCVLKGKHMCAGLGFAYFNGLSRWNGSNFVAALSIEIRPDERWSVNFRHYSNGGSVTPNMGQDILTLGWTF